jgi:hypothetical protein
MGKRKRLIQKAAPAQERYQDLKADVARHGVRSVDELPVPVLLKHRAIRLQAAVISG